MLWQLTHSHVLWPCLFCLTILVGGYFSHRNILWFRIPSVDFQKERPIVLEEDNGQCFKGKGSLIWLSNKLRDTVRVYYDFNCLIYIIRYLNIMDVNILNGNVECRQDRFAGELPKIKYTFVLG